MEIVIFFLTNKNPVGKRKDLNLARRKEERGGMSEAFVIEKGTDFSPALRARERRQQPLSTQIRVASSSVEVGLAGYFWNFLKSGKKAVT